MVFLGILWTIALSIGSFIFNGYTLSVLWGWFAVPIFDLPRLNIGSAIGIAMMIRFLSGIHISNKKINNKKEYSDFMIKATIIAIVRPLLTLFSGWIITIFM